MSRLKLLPLFISLFFLLSKEISAEIRTWTSSTGSKIQAELVSFANNMIVLRSADGRNITLPIYKLGPSDQKFVQGLYSNKATNVRVAAYNVEFGKNASPEEIGKMFKPYNLDIIGFNEVPDGDWTARVGKILGMKHTYVGKISSANHKDKYKSILSLTPLQSTVEHELTVKRSRSWNPASVVRAVTQINGIPISFYSLHVSCSLNSHNTGHAYRLANEILPKDKTDRIIVLGDFNNHFGDNALKKIEQAGMRATWEDLKIDVSKKSTFHALNPKINLGVIDHIFYSTKSKAKVTEGGIIELKKALSDHKPVWAEFSFPQNLK